MRRIALITLLLGCVVAWFVTSAGASDTHTYEVQMYNAFGLVNGSDVRVAGVDAGSVTDLSIDQQKRAVVTISLSGPLSQLGTQTHCSSEPQSLIAEYFLDCNPKGPPLPDGGEIPASHVQETVQTDLVQNALREPYKQRLQILINEFGTALAGNPHDLNQAIRLGAPALTQLRRVLTILANQNTEIRNLNVNSDRIISQLTQRRQDVVSFIQKARDTAAISASRGADLSRNFGLLDNFLAQLQPTLAKLGTLARDQTPLLANLHASAPGLNELALNLPAFNNATTTALKGLGSAGVVGQKALGESRDEIKLLAQAGKQATPVGEMLADFLRDISDPSRATETDARAAKTCNHPSRPCYSTGRSAPTGYTGMEGLLNYLYYQTGAINQFDQVGHLLHFTLYSVNSGPCGSFFPGHDPTTGKPIVPNATGGTFPVGSQSPRQVFLNPKLANCVAWLGPNQPGITTGPHLPPYASSVCPHGTTPAAAHNKLCPGHPKAKSKSAQGGGSAPIAPTGTTQHNRSTPTAPSGGGGGSSGTLVPPVAPSPGSLGLPNNLNGLLQLPGGGGGGLLGGSGGPNLKKGSTGGSKHAAKDLLNFLFSP